MHGGRSQYVRSLSPSSSSGRSSGCSRSPRRYNGAGTPKGDRGGRGGRLAGRKGVYGGRGVPDSPPVSGQLLIQKAARAERFGSGRAEDVLGAAFDR